MNRKSRNKKRRLLQQMRPVSLKDFFEAVGRIAAEHGEEYYNAHVEFSRQRNDLPIRVAYRGYINPRVVYSASTPSEVLDKLREHYASRPAAFVRNVLVDDLPF